MIIAQISDPHVTLDGGKVERLYSTAAHLQRAVRHLNRLPARPDIVLLTGDCVDAGSIAEYSRLRELLSPLAMPVYLIPGNHDNRDNLRQVFGVQGAQAMGEFVQYVVDEGPLRLLAMDSNVPGSQGGNLCEQRLTWLEDRLAEAPARPSLIFVHHPPFRTGLEVLDQIGLEGAEALGEIVARHPQVERVVAGHIHRTMQKRFHGSLAMTCPSTAHQIFLDLGRPQRLAVVMEPPACLLHVWHEATGLLTHSSVIGDYGPVSEIHDGFNWRP